MGRSLYQPSGPDGEGQARGQARNARGEPPQSGTYRKDGLSIHDHQRISSAGSGALPYPAEEKKEDAAERNLNQAGDRPYPPWQETHSLGQKHLAQAQDLPADNERKAEKHDKRREHRAHLLISAKNL
jgi:hypothetical protein